MNAKIIQHLYKNMKSSHYKNVHFKKSCDRKLKEYVVAISVILQQTRSKQGFLGKED